VEEEEEEEMEGKKERIITVLCASTRRVRIALAFASAFLFFVSSRLNTHFSASFCFPPFSKIVPFFSSLPSHF